MALRSVVMVPLQLKGVALLKEKEISSRFLGSMSSKMTKDAECNSKG